MKKITINYDDYDDAYTKWVLDVFKKFHDESTLTNKFDKAIGIRYATTDIGNAIEAGLLFEVLDEKKLFLAVIKYELKFLNYD